MTRKQRLQRAALLCCHCLRNLAYYRSGRHGGRLISDVEFWRTVNANFLDICVLEWCKLFGDARGKHYWGKVITNPQQFKAGLSQELGLSEVELDAYVAKTRKYRDRFIAHLDSDLVMQIPELNVVLKSVSYLYDYLRNNEDESNALGRFQQSASSYFDSSSRQARSVYQP